MFRLGQAVGSILDWRSLDLSYREVYTRGSVEEEEEESHEDGGWNGHVNWLVILIGLALHDPPLAPSTLIPKLGIIS